MGDAPAVHSGIPRRILFADSPDQNIGGGDVFITQALPYAVIFSSRSTTTVS
jgi:hypothetical protein